MRERSKKCLGAMIPALLLWAPAFASSARSLSRLRGKNLAVRSETEVSGTTRGEAASNAGDPFAVFGDSSGPAEVTMVTAGNEVLDFLNSNNLLRAGGEAASQVSGEVDSVLGRKEFSAHACSTRSGWLCTWYTYSYCVNYGGTWVTVPPTIQSSSVSNISASGFTLNVDISDPATVYAVVVARGGSAPTSAQVKAGKDGSGAAAVAGSSLVLNSGSYAGSINFSVANANQNLYNVYFVAEDSGGMTATPKVHNVLTPTTYSKGTLHTYVDPAWSNVDIERDSSNNIYTFYQSTPGNYRISKWNGSAWATYTELSSGGLTGMNAERADMVIDTAGAIHLLTNAGTGTYDTTGDMYYNMYSGGSWSGFVKVYDGNNGIEGNTGSPDFAFADSSNKIHVTYAVSEVLYYSTNATGSWVTTSLGGVHVNNGGQRWTVVESNGKAHVVYEDGNSQDIVTASSDNFAAKTMLVDTSEYIKGGNVIVDGSNKLHLVYSNTQQGKAYYKSNSSGVWTEEQLTSPGFSNLQAIYIKFYGTVPYVLMYNATEQLFYFKRKVGGVWEDGKFFQAEGANAFLIDTVNDKIHIPFEPGSDLYHIFYYVLPTADLFAAAPPPNTAPTFVGAGTTLTATQNGGATSFASLVHASDSDASQTLTWSQQSAPSHGALTITSATAASGSTDITPGGTLNYTPTAGYGGTDSFTVQVSDATATATRTISVNVNPAAPGTPDLAAGSDSGSSSTDNRTNATSLNLSGSSAAADTTSTVRVFIDKNANSIYDSTTDPSATATVNNGSWSVSGLSTIGVLNGTYNVLAYTSTAVGSLASPLSAPLSFTLDNSGPTVTDANINISGATGPGPTFKIGDTVTATWNNTAGGDNNPDVASVTVNFAQFGGGAIPAGNLSGTWTATYTITSGTMDYTNRNVAVAATDTAGNSTVTSDTANATLDNQPPTVSAGRIALSGATGPGGVFRIGDTVRANWDNSGGGDNNPDTMTSVTIDFSQFGGGAAVAATETSGNWSATHTITGGAIDTTNLNVAVTATDNGGNATTTSSTANATLDNVAPTVSDEHLSLSGGSGSSGAFLDGDTVTASWDNSGSGDNNPDIGGVTFDFSQFGGGGAVVAGNSGNVWSATCFITGATEANNLNVSATVTDNGGNSTTTSDTSNATVDSVPPVVTDAHLAISGGSGPGGGFRVGDTVTATWDNSGSGDNNFPDIAEVSFNFGQFGGGSSVAASNSGDLWSATFLITNGSIDAGGRNVLAIVRDDAGNSTITGDTSNATVDNQPPTVSDAHLAISGATGPGGVFRVGDTVTATWDNTAGGDNNPDISGVTFDFSQFGGAAAVAAGNSGGLWSASFTVTAGSLDAGVVNVSATATDDGGNSTTTSDTSNAVLDNQPAVITDANLSISGGTGLAGTFRIGDTVTATWDNTASGDNNPDPISGVTFDFSQFGGGAAVAAGDSGGLWSAAFTITAGTLDAVGVNVSATVRDNGGNATTTVDSSNASVDTQAPLVSAGNLTLGGASGLGGAFRAGDTLTATWDNSGDGDNNPDPISGVTFDFSQFGGESAVAAGNSGNLWSATYTIPIGILDVTDRNVNVFVSDDAGNPTNLSGTSNATLDNQPPVVSDSALGISGATGSGGVFRIGDTVTATWDNSASGDHNSDPISGVTFDFSQFGGGSAVAAGNSGDIWSATYTIEAGSIEATSRNISATASDDAGNPTTTSDSANATVDNQPPAVATGTLTIAENSPNGSPVGTVTADGAVAYSLLDDAGGRFAIGSASGEVTVANGSLLDHETSDNYQLTIQASDALGNVSQTILGVTVTDVNEAPLFSGTPALSGTPLVGQTLSLSDTGTSDPDGNPVTLTYQWQADGGDISGATSATYQLTVAEIGTSVTCLLTIDDGQGQPNSVTTVSTGGVLVAPDSDGDGVADSLDICSGYDDAVDGDGDTIPDGCDNCPLLGNSSQADANGNGIGDACDSASDTDRDGLSDADEVIAGTDPSNPDSDGDGFFDGQEAAAGTDPLDPNSEPLLARTVRQDFNGDGRGDILWHRDSDGANLVWLTGPDGFTVATSSWMGTLSTKWQILGVGDFNGDHNADLLYRDEATGQQLVYLTSSDGTRNETKAWLGHPMLAASGWNYGATGDFNGDGRADILWHNDAEGYLVWFTGPTGLSVADTQWIGWLNPVWSVLGTGDFNGDGNADLICRNLTTGQQLVALTSSDGMTMATKKWLGSALPLSSGWLFNDIGDFNGDGRDDLLWRRNGDGANLVWYLGADGITVERKQQIGNLGNWWSLLGAGDFNGDGNADLLYRAEGNGQQLVYQTSGDGLSMESKKMLGHPVDSGSGWRYVGK